MKKSDPDLSWQFPLSRKDRSVIAWGGALYVAATVAAVLLLILLR